MSLDDDLRSRLAHDLRTPLAAIVGYAELLRVREDEEIRREAPAQILAAAERLTAAIEDLLALLAAGAGATPLPGLNGGRRRQVVVVDDDALVRSLLRTTLPSDQFDVVEAGDGQAALRLAEERPPALVLLDWRMPGRSGADVLAELKTRFPELPVIVLTAERDPRQRELAETLGANIFLTKPFSPLRLLEVVEQLLRERPLDQAS